MVQTTTIEALPVTLSRIEERMKVDLAESDKSGARADESARIQGSRSREWINRELRTYLGKLKALLRK